jgi:hypothetical protein
LTVLSQLLASFVTIGSDGVWGGPVHHLDPPVTTVAESGEPLVVWSADMGSAGSAALDALIGTVDVWRQHQALDVERFVIGSSRYW